jgi:hypothetical protein
VISRALVLLAIFAWLGGASVLAKEEQPSLQRSLFSVESLLGEEKEQPFRADLKGHVSSLWVFLKDRSNSAGGDSTFNSNRLRLEGRLFYLDHLTLTTVCDVEAFTGSFLATPSWAALSDPQATSLWDLMQSAPNGQAVELRQSVYRLYGTYQSDALSAVVGKQRIAWGVMRFWRPTDLFNTESPLQIDEGERTGLDAIRVSAPLSPRSDVEGVYAPSRSPGGDVRAAKLRFTSGEYDVSLVGARTGSDDIVGFSIDGYVGKGGLRGEYISVRSPDRAPWSQWTIGADYSFPGSLTLTAEYLYSGGNTLNPVNPFVQYRGVLRTRRSHLLGVSGGFSISPLVSFSLFSSADIDGGSIALSSRLRWNARENMDVVAGCSFFSGSADGEYGSVPNLFFLQAKLYF